MQDACRSLFSFRPHGEAQGPSIQALALAATKSGANSADLQQLASQYCKSDSIKLPEPYFVDTPVRVRTADDWVLTVKPVALYLPHEWFAWLQLEEQAAGFRQLEEFWENHPMGDPKLDGNPVMDASWQQPCSVQLLLTSICLGPLRAACFLPRKGVASTCPSFSMVMEELSRDQIPLWFSACDPCYLHPVWHTARCSS